MKIKDIAIGGVYLTKVSGVFVQVRVLAKVEHVYVARRPDMSRRKTTSFTVVRVDNGKRLANRSAAALHPLSERKGRPGRAVEPGHVHTVDCAVFCRGKAS